MTKDCAVCGSLATREGYCQECFDNLLKRHFEQREQAEQAEKGTWGGPRPGAGRKGKWGGKTVTVRVPEWAKDRVLQLVEDIDKGHAVRAVEARELLRDHLEDVGRKGTIKRSVIRQALWLLGEGADESGTTD